ncbi:MAG: PEP/pyruvate-binding domain-containing protein [Caldilineaceae bacterium]
MQWIRWFHELTIADVPQVGGKNASLGEMVRELTPKGIQIPNGFAVTAQAYRAFLQYNELENEISHLLSGLDIHNVDDLLHRTAEIRRAILTGEFPADMRDEILACYHELSEQYGARSTDVAVRSSATAEDLPTASFAGQQETYLNAMGRSDGVGVGQEVFCQPLYPTRHQLSR